MCVCAGAFLHGMLRRPKERGNRVAGFPPPLLGSLFNRHRNTVLSLSVYAVPTSPLCLFRHIPLYLPGFSSAVPSLGTSVLNSQASCPMSAVPASIFTPIILRVRLWRDTLFLLCVLSPRPTASGNPSGCFIMGDLCPGRRPPSSD